MCIRDSIYVVRQATQGLANWVKTQGGTQTVAISYDSRLKSCLLYTSKEGIYSEYARDVVRPSTQECAQNGRARSTKMRWAVKAE